MFECPHASVHAFLQMCRHKSVTEPTVCDVQYAGLVLIFSIASSCSRLISGVIAFSSTSIPTPGTGHDVISLRLVASVTYTMSPKVYFHVGSPVCLFGNPGVLLPYLTAACRSLLEMLRSSLLCRPCGLDKIVTDEVASVNDEVSLLFTMEIGCLCDGSPRVQESGRSLWRDSVCAKDSRVLGASESYI